MLDFVFDVTTTMIGPSGGPTHSAVSSEIPLNLVLGKKYILKVVSLIELIYPIEII